MANAERKSWIVETSKKIDKAGMVIGGAVYLAAGVPFALFVAGMSALSFGATVGGEKLYKNWKSKLKGSK